MLKVTNNLEIINQLMMGIYLPLLHYLYVTTLIPHHKAVVNKNNI